MGDIKLRHRIPLFAGMVALSFMTQPSSGQTPSPTEPPSTPGLVVFVDGVGVSIRRDSDTLPNGCSPTEVVKLLTAFLDAFNQGNQQLLPDFFAAETSRNQEGAFQWYSVNGPPGGFNPGFTAESRDELMTYFNGRHKHGERMQLLQIEYGIDPYWENGTRGIDFTLDVLRSADDIPTHEAGVKGAIDCLKQTIYVWSMSDRGVVPDSWFGKPIATPTD